MSVIDDSHDRSFSRGVATSGLVAPPRPQARKRLLAKPVAPRAGLHPGLWLGLVLVATLIAYGACVTHYFFLDDFWHLAKAHQTPVKDLWRPWIYSGADYRSYWFSNSRVHGLSEPGFFRPLVTMVYAAGLALWGAEAGPFHAVNVAAHLATTALLFWLAWRLFASGWVAALTAAVYGVHPCHYETVEWIAANADALVAMLGLLSIAAFFEAIQRRGERVALGPNAGGGGFLALALTGFALALGAKEMAVTIPAVLLALETWDWIDRGGSWTDLKERPRHELARIRARLMWHVPFWLLLGGFLAWRIPAAMGLMTLKEGSNYASGMTGLLFLPHLVLNFVFYGLHYFLLYPIFPVNFADLGWHCWWLAGVAVGVLAALGIWFPRLAGPRASQCRLGLVWIAVTLLPFCFLTPGQRIAHFPAAGFAVAVGAIAAGIAYRLEAQPRAMALARLAAAALLVVYTLFSLSYVTTLGYVTSLVQSAESGLEAKLATSPAGTQVYLINLWQPAWMFERLIEIDYPNSHYDVQVLSFDPVIIPEGMREHPNFMTRCFAYCFPDQSQATQTKVKWATPGRLIISTDKQAFLNGVVEDALPVAAEAREVGRVIPADSFDAWTSAASDKGPTELTFHFRAQVGRPKRVFLFWDGQRWQQLQPPPGWDGKSF